MACRRSPDPGAAEKPARPLGDAMAEVGRAWASKLRNPKFVGFGGEGGWGGGMCRV